MKKSALDKINVHDHAQAYSYALYSLHDSNIHPSENKRTGEKINIIIHKLESLSSLLDYRDYILDQMYIQVYLIEVDLNTLLSIHSLMIFCFSFTNVSNEDGTELRIVRTLLYRTTPSSWIKSSTFELKS